MKEKGSELAWLRKSMLHNQSYVLYWPLQLASDVNTLQTSNHDKLQSSTRVSSDTNENYNSNNH